MSLDWVLIKVFAVLKQIIKIHGTVSKVEQQLGLMYILSFFFFFFLLFL